MTGADRGSALERVARWCELELTGVMRAQLAEFEGWLSTEAIASGGVGPGEAERVVERHLADSLSFARPLRGRAVPTLVDLGSGSGLPGIPLAIVLPATRVTLVDRGGRRVDLAERAQRVVGIDNVTVIQGDLRNPVARFDAVTMRAVLAPMEAVGAVRKWLAPGGIGVVGLSRGTAPPADAPSGRGLDIVGVPADVLDSPGWLLTIRS